MTEPKQKLNYCQQCNNVFVYLYGGLCPPCRLARIVVLPKTQPLPSALIELLKEREAYKRRYYCGTPPIVEEPGSLMEALRNDRA